MDSQTLLLDSMMDADPSDWALLLHRSQRHVQYLSELLFLINKCTVCKKKKRFVIKRVTKEKNEDDFVM